MNEVIFGQPWHLYSTNRLVDWQHMPSVCVRQGCLSRIQVCLWSLCKLTLKGGEITLHHASLSIPNSAGLTKDRYSDHMCDVSATLDCFGKWHNDAPIRDEYLDRCCKSCDLSHSETWKGFWTIFILYAWLKCSICVLNPFTEKHFEQGDLWGKYNSPCIPPLHCGVSYAGRAQKPHCCLPLTSAGSDTLCV